MLRIHAGRSDRYCDGLSRRSFVQVGVAGMASVGLPQILAARAAAATGGQAGDGGSSPDTSVILVWLDGGPSHMDLYDLKPEAPAEYRGLWRPISTNVPGMEISELFPLQAQLADKFSIVRSLHHDNGDHFTGAHWMLTGFDGVNGLDTAGRSPSIGAIAARLLGPRRAEMPAYVSVPVASSIGLRPGYFAGNYLGVEHNPFETEGDPNAADFQVRNLNLVGGLSIDRLEDRQGLLKHFDRMRREVDSSGMAAAMDRFELAAYELVSGDAARKAFDINAEEPARRDAYGRHPWGQSTLLARRLVEAGCRFVTVHMGGWDNHWDLKTAMESYLPSVDRALASLYRDLADRGLADKTLVVVCGEFSRTPRMNDGGNGGAPMSMGTPGRDHWGNAMFCILAGGGVRGGMVVGATNRLGEHPIDRAVRPGDIHATIYQVLGIDPTTSFLNHAGRPVPIVGHGQAISELLG